MFLCGSLEPGKDGVGDYTHRLAAELILRDHKIGIVALRDQHINHQIECSKSTGVDKILPILRLPANWPAKRRFTKAKEWIETFQPDWVSLQFVIFSFQPKGLPFGLSNHLAGLAKNSRWHIMFHELWVGMHQNASNKFILWGWLQKGIVRSFLKKISPQVIHTQNLLFQFQLNNLTNVRPEILPLFSNIPKVIFEEPDSFSKKRENALIIVSFGYLHPNAQTELFIEELGEYQKNNNTKICLQIIGHAGPQTSKWTKLCETNNIELKIIGNLSAEEISRLLQNASAGITTTAEPMVLKSGSVAAMREHGLPIICISNQWSPRRRILTDALPDGMFKFHKGAIESFLKSQKRDIHIVSVAEVSDLFLESLRKN